MIHQHDRDYWKRIEGLALAAAHRAGLNHDDAEDCAVEFEVILLTSGGPDDLDAPGTLDQLRQQIWWHVKTCVHRRNRVSRDVITIAQLAESAARGLAGEPVSPDPGPEDLAIQRAELAAMMRIVNCLSERQRWLWRRVRNRWSAHS